MRLHSFLLVLLLAACGFSNPGLAHEKTDIVTLYNGDRITGELQTMYGGIATLRTTALGTIKIEWERISKIESNYYYDVRLSTGERHLVAIDKTNIPGQIKVVSEDNEYTFEMLEVVEMRPVENSFSDRIDLYLSAGYSYTKASSVGQTSFNTEVSYEDKNTRNTFTGRTTITDTNEEVTSSTKLDLSRQVWSDRSKSYRIFSGRFEANDELNLEGRYTLGAGLGRYFIDTQKVRWMGALGLQVITEKNDTDADGECLEGEEPASCSDKDSRGESVELFVSTSVAAWRFDTPELDIDIKFNLYPSLSEHSRLRGDTDIRIRWELIEDLYWDITAFATYDNAGTDHDIDYGITTGIGWTY